MSEQKDSMSERVAVEAPDLEAGLEASQCDYDPRELAGQPIGMFHCPKCGDMVLAGLPHPPPDLNEPQSEREFFCHWLLRAYEAESRDMSVEEGESLRDVMREINQVLGFAGYEPEDGSREELLAMNATWTLYPVEIVDGKPVQQFPDAAKAAQSTTLRSSESTDDVSLQSADLPIGELCFGFKVARRIHNEVDCFTDLSQEMHVAAVIEDEYLKAKSAAARTPVAQGDAASAIIAALRHRVVTADFRGTHGAVGVRVVRWSEVLDAVSALIPVPPVNKKSV